MDRLAVAGALSRGVFAGCLLVSLVVLFAPAGNVPAALPGVDTVVHLLLFAALAVAGRWAGFRTRQLALLLAGYAALSEVLQAVTPLARTGSLADLLADLAGAVLGLVAWSALRRPGAAGSLGR
jgi:VanZ like family